MSPNAAQRTVVDDLLAKEQPIPLGELPDQDFVPRRKGKKIHVASVYRAAQTGELETGKGIGGKFTTRSAWFRFVARRSAGATPVPRVPVEQRRREVERAKSVLSAAGIA